MAFDPAGWRPIETAPKDGAVVVLWVPNPGGGFCQTGRFIRQENAWLDSWEGEGLGEPSHWMPCPPEPLTQQMLRA